MAELVIPFVLWLEGDPPFDATMMAVPVRIGASFLPGNEDLSPEDSMPSRVGILKDGRPDV